MVPTRCSLLKTVHLTQNCVPAFWPNATLHRIDHDLNLLTCFTELVLTAGHTLIAELYQIIAPSIR